MNTIYKILLVVLVFISSIGMYGQRSQRRLNTDFKIGLNFAQLDIAGGNMYKQPKLGMHIGGNISYKFFSDFQVQTGFFVSKKGLRQHENTSVTDPTTGLITSKDNLFVVDINYMQMPFNIGFEKYLTKTFAFNLNAGAYAAYGFRGTTRRQTFEIISSSEPVQTDSGELEAFGIRGLNRFDYGLGASAGIISDIYTLTFSYEYGLKNISNNPTQNFKNRNISVSLGFRF